MALSLSIRGFNRETVVAERDGSRSPEFAIMHGEQDGVAALEMELRYHMVVRADRYNRKMAVPRDDDRRKQTAAAVLPGVEGVGRLRRMANRHPHRGADADQGFRRHHHRFAQAVGVARLHAHRLGERVKSRQVIGHGEFLWGPPERRVIPSTSTPCHQGTIVMPFSATGHSRAGQYDEPPGLPDCSGRQLPVGHVLLMT